jgi:hypothetical protein
LKPPTAMRPLSIELAIVCFFDILGFRDLVTAPGDRDKIARRLDSSMRRALEAFGGRKLLRGTRDAEWRLRVFSDCISLAKPLSDLGVCVTLDASARFTQEMLSDGFPIRGGIEIGPYLETDLLLFSEAQIAAYDIESKVAKQPRVVMSEKFVDYLSAIGDDDFRWLAKELLIKDADGQIFLNYMIFYEEDDWLGGARFYRALKSVLSATLKKEGMPERVREKFEWMADLHNWSLWHTAKLLKQGRLDEDIVWDFRSYYVAERAQRRGFTPLISLDPAFLRLIGDDDKKQILEDGYAASGGPRHQRRGVDWIRDHTALTENDEVAEDILDGGDFLLDADLYQVRRDEEAKGPRVEVSSKTAAPKLIVDKILAKNITPIAAWRKHLGLSQAALAKELEMSRSDYLHLERSHSPTLGALKKVAKALGIKVEMLLI